ncbi:hypothetical protein [Methanocaldococcus jannaschii]|nr:hypothetical protein [Methanocaldococcus jannaschii]
MLWDAFTDKPVEFKGTIRELLDKGNRAEIIATLNAVMRCAKKLVEYLKN